jgi:hypothetical protein
MVNLELFVVKSFNQVKDGRFCVFIIPFNRCNWNIQKLEKSDHCLVKWRTRFIWIIRELKRAYVTADASSGVGREVFNEEKSFSLLKNDLEGNSSFDFWEQFEARSFLLLWKLPQNETMKFILTFLRIKSVYSLAQYEAQANGEVAVWNKKYSFKPIKNELFLKVVFSGKADFWCYD